MKTKTYFCIICAITAMSTNVSAQGVSNKMENSAITKNKVVETANEPAKNIDLKKAPKYSVQLEQEVNDANQPVLNEDGTPKLRAFLVDQDGNKRSPEAVKEQIKAIKRQLATIFTNVGIGVVIGALEDGGAENAAFVAAGTLASADNIVIAAQLKKDLSQQKKMLKAYEKNFTTEGLPKDAKADLTKIKNLDLDIKKVVSKSSAAIKEELDNESFNDSSLNWEIE